MAGALIAGYEIAILAYNSLVKRHTVGPAMLMCIACVASFIIGHPEEGAAVTFLYYIAEFLEDYAEHRAKRSIKSLVEIAPETARVKVGDSEELRNVDDVNIGEIVIVKPGDKVPLDGNVVSGSSSINQASITGESVPVLKEVGDEVFSGTVNVDGYFEMVVTKRAKDSVISKIVTLVKRSQLNRSETESLVEKVAKRNDLESKRVALVDEIAHSKSQFDAQIAPYAKQIESMTALIKTIEEKRDAAVAEKAAEEEALAVEVKKLDEELASDREIMKALLPEDANKMGF
jgi:magnesium-transporting ATPase (P-type)